MERFENKVIVVTGGASGIGEATARRLTAEGGKVVIADYNEKGARQVATCLLAEGYDVKYIYFSAAELDSCREVIEFTRQNYGRVDVLVNNVGGTDLKRDGNVAKVDMAYFDEAVHINLRSALYLSQLAIPLMIGQDGGNIVNVASVGGITGDWRGTLYGILKAALVNLTRYTATQFGKKNIRCNAVAPGLTLTPAAEENLPVEMRRMFIRHNALDYLGEPEDIAAAIAFLASSDARYITGQTLVVDGGLTIHNPTVGDLMPPS